MNRTRCRPATYRIRFTQALQATKQLQKRPTIFLFVALQLPGNIVSLFKHSARQGEKNGMKAFGLIAILIVVFCSFIQDQALTIIPGQGVGPLEINKTTKKNVENHIGKGKPTKEFISFCSRGQGTFKKFVYAGLGLELIYSDLNNPKEKDTLTIIRIIESSKLKTIEGIGIGTKRKEVEKYLGKPIVVKFETLVSGAIYHSVRYKEIEFVFDSDHQTTLDTMDYRVKLIEMWKTH